MGAGLEGVDENLEAGRVTRQLEQAHDSDDAEELEKVVLSVEPRQQEVEVERDGRHEVDDVDGRAEESQDVRTDGEPHNELEGEPGVTGALDVEEGEVLIGRALVQHPDGPTAAVRRARHGDVDDDRHAQIRMCFETEDGDGNEDEEYRQRRDDLDKDNATCSAQLAELFVI